MLTKLLRAGIIFFTISIFLSYQLQIYSKRDFVNSNNIYANCKYKSGYPFVYTEVDKDISQFTSTCYKNKAPLDNANLTLLFLDVLLLSAFLSLISIFVYWFTFLFLKIPFSIPLLIFSIIFSYIFNIITLINAGGFPIPVIYIGVMTLAFFVKTKTGLMYQFESGGFDIIVLPLFSIIVFYPLFGFIWKRITRKNHK